MRWFTAIGGVIATAAAIVVLQALSTPAPEESATAPTTVPPPAAVFFEEVPAATIDDSALEKLPGLSPAIAEALADAGYSGFATDENIKGSLSSAVVQTLVAKGAVLVIPQDGQGTQEGDG